MAAGTALEHILGTLSGRLCLAFTRTCGEAFSLRFGIARLEN
jgi:hypothetical protein